MSLPNWFYPLVMIWLLAVPLINRRHIFFGKRNIWLMLIDTLFLLPWVLTLAHDEPIAAWIGLEIVGMVLLFDMLWQKPRELLREAWVKLSMNWFLSWLLIGTAVALSGVQPVLDNLFFPLPVMEVERIRPVLAAVMFVLGLALKLGFPPFQQGIIDVMEVLDADSHRRWALLMRWAIVFSAWQLMPNILSPLSGFNQQLIALFLIGGCLCAWLVAGVQAGVQRTFSYMGTLLVLLPILNSLFMDPRLGLNEIQNFAVWGVTVLGFLILGWVYQSWPESSLKDSDILLWTDVGTPCSLPGWSLRMKMWMGWSLLASLSLVYLSCIYLHWLMGILSLLLALATASTCLRQLGIATWKQQQS